MLILLIPIGGPGAGKTTLSHNLKSLDLGIDKVHKVFTTCRDELFAMCKKDHVDWSQRKIRRFRFDKFVEFRESVASWCQEHPDDTVIVYLDSSNAARGGRQYLIDEFLPDRVVLLNMRYGMETLLERVGVRQGHPTFPQDRGEQSEIVSKILGGLEFAGEEDLISSNGIEIQIMELGS